MAQQDLVKIGIRLELPFSSFDRAARNKFLDDLALVTGCTPEDILEPTFWSGCVKFEGKVPPQVAGYLLECYKALTVEGIYDEHLLDFAKEVALLIKKYKISDINSGHSAKITHHFTVNAEAENSVIFVHGWRGSGESLQDLSQYVADETKFRTYIYEYPSPTFGSAPPLYYIAQNFDNWIRNTIGNNKISIVAHSFGGIVSRKMLTSQAGRYAPLDRSLSCLAFIASPHDGSWLSKVVKRLPFVAIEQVSDLDGRSPVLTELQASWQEWLRKHPDLLPHVRSIYGTADEVVDPAVAIGCDPEAIPILNAKHETIVKPSSRSDEIVTTLVRLIRSAAESC